MILLITQFVLLEVKKLIVYFRYYLYINIIKNLQIIPDNQLGIYSDNPDTLEIMSHVCSEHPNTLIIDDDFTKPESAHVLSAIRKVNENVKIPMKTMTIMNKFLLNLLFKFVETIFCLNLLIKFINLPKISFLRKK